MHDPLEADFHNALEHFQKGEIERSEELCAKILEKNSRHSNTLNLMGIICWRQGAAEKAIQYIQKAMEYFPEKAPIFANNLALIHADLGNIGMAADIYATAAEAFYQRKEQDEMLNCLEKGAYLLRDHGSLAEAKEFYLKILKVNPRHLSAYNDLGLIMQQEKNYEGAIACFKRVLSLDPDYATAYNNLGVAYQLQKKPKEAIVLYEKTLELDPECHEAHTNLGNLYREEENFDKAMHHCQKALELVPEHWGVHNNLGVLFYHQGKLEPAIDHFRKALQFNPSYQEAQKNLEHALKDLEHAE